MKIASNSIYLFVIFISTSITSHAQHKIAGEYVTNFSSYGIFGKRLKLNCDSTATLNFAGDLMNDTSNSKWTLQNGILILKFDTINFPKQRYKGTMKFKIKRNRLYQISFTRREYDQLTLQILADSAKTNASVKIPSYQQFERMTNKSFKNFAGKEGVQYYKKTTGYDCH